MNIGKLIWGLIVIFIGLIFLLINYGVLSPTIWASIWKLWPLILIVAGLSIISKSLSTIGQIILNIVVVIMIIAGLAWVITSGNYSFDKNSSTYNQASATQYIDESASDQSKSAKVTIKTGAAKLNIDGDSDQLISGTIDGNFPVDVNRSISDGEENIELSTSSNRISFFNRIKNDWQLSLNKSLRTSLELNTGAVDGNLELQEVNLENLIVKSGVSSYNIRLGDKLDKLSGQFDIGASSLKIKVPKSSGLKVNSKSGASSNNFTEVGLKKSGDDYTSDNFDSSSKKIELTIKAGASSIELERI